MTAMQTTKKAYFSETRYQEWTRISALLDEPKKRKAKTYNSGDSPVVTHLTTSPPVRCLNRAERTGSLVFNVLWSYVEDLTDLMIYIKNIWWRSLT
jgi:hypothetical protein